MVNVMMRTVLMGVVGLVAVGLMMLTVVRISPETSAPPCECNCVCESAAALPDGSCPLCPALNHDVPSCPVCPACDASSSSSSSTMLLEPSVPLVTPTFRTVAPCGEKQALVVALASQFPMDLVNLRRMCETAGIVYPAGTWKVRTYAGRELTADELGIMKTRCRLCIEQVIVVEEEEKEGSSLSLPWWNKYHALQDESVDVALFRSIHSRPIRREARLVASWIQSAKPFHTIRDHPTLHRRPIVAHLWGAMGASQARKQVAAEWKSGRGRTWGEEAMLAAWSRLLVGQMSAADAVFPAATFPGIAWIKVDDERLGIEYCGRLADQRERDIHHGFREMVRMNGERRSKALPECLSDYSGYTKPPLLAARDEERRYLSYSLYGSRAVDRDELIKVVTLLKHDDFYWGWGVMLFVRADVSAATIQAIVAAGRAIEVYQVDTEGACGFLAKDPMLWRYIFPMRIAHVDRFVSRDADSIIWPREWHAVTEWMQSGLNFHMMRDHSNGHDNAVMGGMWGAVGHAYPKLYDEVKKHYPAYIHNDQVFLGKVLYDNINDVALGHDSHFCLKFTSLPFPDPMWSHFVGQTPTYRHTPAPDVPACSSSQYDAFLA